MAALLSQRFPAKAPELFVYLATIVRAERNYEAGRWAAYDRQYRHEALARKSLDWSVPDPRLYNEAFTGRAKAIPRCAMCLMDDHQAHSYPQGRVNRCISETLIHRRSRGLSQRHNTPRAVLK